MDKSPTTSAGCGRGAFPHSDLTLARDAAASCSGTSRGSSRDARQRQRATAPAGAGANATTRSRSPPIRALPRSCRANRHAQAGAPARATALGQRSVAGSGRGTDWRSGSVSALERAAEAHRALEAELGGGGGPAMAQYEVPLRVKGELVFGYQPARDLTTCLRAAHGRAGPPRLPGTWRRRCSGASRGSIPPGRHERFFDMGEGGDLERRASSGEIEQADELGGEPGGRIHPDRRNLVDGWRCARPARGRSSP